VICRTQLCRVPLLCACSVEELTQAFSLDRITKSAAVFDKVKLNWMNGQHLRWGLHRGWHASWGEAVPTGCVPPLRQHLRVIESTGQIHRQGCCI
jgi:hypothetical protein